MIGRLAVRSLTAHPVRSGILAAGFGVGVAVMAILLGVAEVVLEQAQAPGLVGGGDVAVRLGRELPAQFLLSGTLQSEALRPRVRAAAPFRTSSLFVIHDDGAATRVDARGGIPSLERAIGDEETAGLAEWRDSPADLAWTARAPEELLRHIDRFRPIPDAPAWAHSWAEWLYFNGRASDARFYVTFLVGPRLDGGRRAAGVRLQLERDGRVETFSQGAELSEEDALRAPDLSIGASSVRLEGMRYRLHLDLVGEGGRRVRGDLTVQASPGHLVPPVEISGANSWLTGYVVPVTSGRLDGALTIADERVVFDGGTGYHDHNWGFWEGVSWQWGQVQHEDLSFVFGRVFPPPSAADPERMGGFLGALGPDGPLGYATNVRITETNDAGGRPETIAIEAIGAAVSLEIRFDVTSSVSTPMAQGPMAGSMDLLQLRGRYTVTGSAAGREIDFTAPGAAETFRGGGR
jgi:hypothetical protein